MNAAVMEATRMGAFSGSARTDRQIMAAFDAAFAARLAKDGRTLLEIEQMLRATKGMSRLRARPVPVPQFWYYPVGVIALLLIAAPLAYWAKAYLRTAACPKDPAKPFTVLFVGIADEIRLSERFPDAMDAAVAVFLRHVHASVAEHGCFEAQRIGNTIMVVSKSPTKAIECAGAIVRRCQGELWTKFFAVDGARTSLNKSASQSPSRSPSRRSPVGTGSVGSAPSAYSTAGHKHASIQPHVGVWHGLGTIDHDEVRDTYNYAGACVSAAAQLADAAAEGRQILVAGQLVDALDEQGAAYRGVFREAGALRLQGAPDDTPVQAYRGVGCRRAEYALPTATPNSERDDGDVLEMAGVILGQLEQASGGLTTKHIAVGCIYVQELRNPAGKWSREEHGRRLVEAFAVVDDTCCSYTGHTDSLTDGRFVVSVNAVVAAAQAGHRVASIALECCDKLSALGYRANAGIAVGASMVGTSLDWTNMAQHINCGRTLQRATMLQAVASFADVPVAALGSLEQQLAPKFVCQCVDVCKVPGIAAHASLVVGVMAESDVEPDEWLYQLQRSADTNPYRDVNAAMRRLLDQSDANQRVPTPNGGAAAADDDPNAAFLASLRSPSELERELPAYTGAGAKALLAYLDMNRPVADYAAERAVAMRLRE
jgi:class 3 adenylate cyclase